MGKATRWLKGLFGMSKEKDMNSNSSSGDRKSKKSSSIGRSGRERGTGAFCQTIPPNLSPAEATWLRSFYSETESDQSKHAIAVAAATAAAADAAVAAAQAAAAVVRLTSHGRGTMFCGGGERLAAMKIQAVFRGFLARKALRALKGLVKIQALVRGFLVRKQATATLHGMQALIRAQATVRAHKFKAQIGPRKSQERFDDTRSEHFGSVHSRRLSASLDVTFNSVDETPKIVEVDTGRPKSKSRRTNTSISDFGDDPLFQTLSSPNPSCRHPGRISIPEYRNFPETESCAGDECRFSTAQSTPRFTNAPTTPARSVCGDNIFRQYGKYPSYMASTQSFKAKSRSYSAPKQRPEKRLSVDEMMESRSSLSDVRMQRSCSQAISFKNAVMGKLDRSADFSKETRRYSISGNIRN